MARQGNIFLKGIREEGFLISACWKTALSTLFLLPICVYPFVYSSHTQNPRCKFMVNSLKAKVFSYSEPHLK